MQSSFLNGVFVCPRLGEFSSLLFGEFLNWILFADLTFSHCKILINHYNHSLLSCKNNLSDSSRMVFPLLCLHLGIISVAYKCIRKPVQPRVYFHHFPGVNSERAKPRNLRGHAWLGGHSRSWHIISCLDYWWDVWCGNRGEGALLSAWLLKPLQEAGLLVIYEHWRLLHSKLRFFCVSYCWWPAEVRLFILCKWWAGWRPGSRHLPP